MTFDEVWDAVKGSDPKENWNNHPKYNPPNLCPRCNDTKEITETKKGIDGVPIVVVRPCPLCQQRDYPGYPGGSSFKKAWDHVRK